MENRRTGCQLIVLGDISNIVPILLINLVNQVSHCTRLQGALTIIFALQVCQEFFYLGILFQQLHLLQIYIVECDVACRSGFDHRVDNDWPFIAIFIHYFKFLDWIRFRFCRLRSWCWVYLFNLVSFVRVSLLGCYQQSSVDYWPGFLCFFIDWTFANRWFNRVYLSSLRNLICKFLTHQL